MRKCLFGIYAFCIMMIMPALVHAYTTDDLVEDFEWKETDNTVEIAVGESYQLHYSCSTIGHGVFSDYYKNEGCWMYYSFSGGQHIISEPTGYSIDKNGVITGLKEGKWALKPTSLIIGKSGTDKWLYINVVSVKTEKESNNTLDTANEFTSKIKFCLDNQADIDYFKYKHNKKFGEYVKFKVNYLGSGDFPSFYKWSTYSAGQNVGSGSLMSQGQICKALVVSGEYVYFQVYFNTSYSQYYQYNDYFTVEVVEDDEPQDQSVTGVSLDATSLTLTEGETKMLTATVSPDNATNKNVSWSSSNAEVASVDKSGTVTAVAEGSATITVTTEDGGKTAICEVTVQANSEPEPDEPSGTKMIIHKIDGEAVVYYVNEIDSVEFIPGPLHVQSITLSPANLVLDVEESATLTATVLPADADNVEVEWSSSDSDIAYVTQKGKVFTLDYGTCTITCTAKDGSGVSASCTVKVSSFLLNGHEYVDLGLPSGLLWATCNVGAENPEDYGDYYAWGETETKESFHWSNYKWSNGSKDFMTKYCTKSNFGAMDGKIVLDIEDDVAHVKWGGKWRMPTKEEMEELWKNCKWERTKQNGVNGYKVIGPNGSSIFFPAAGHYESRLYSIGERGSYRTSTMCFDSWLDAGDAWYLYFSDYVDLGGDYRFYGESVRPVWGESKYIEAESVTISSKSIELEENSSATLEATVAPSTATYTTISWSSSNTNVATVDQRGVVTAIKAGTTTITATSKNGKQASCVVKVAKPLDLNGHTYVDLGLPSGTLWATCNVGADEPYDYGDYFAWGETEGYNSGKTTFSWRMYKYCNGHSSALTKYCTDSSQGTVDNKTILEPSDDAAAANWGGDWRMPTHAEWLELNNTTYCTWTWYGSGNADFGGKAGYKVESKMSGYEGNFIFLPAAGSRYDSGLNYAGSDGYYWSSSLRESLPFRACDCQFGSSYHDEDRSNGRCSGQSVRPVARP